MYRVVLWVCVICLGVECVASCVMGVCDIIGVCV